MIVSSMLGASEVATLAITVRLFQFVSQPIAMMINPLWPSYANAAVRQDTAYIRSTLKTSMARSTIAAALGAATIFTCHPWLVEMWTTGKIEIPILFIFGYAIWCVFEVAGNSFAMYLNGLSILRPQLIVVSLFCLLAIPLKIYLVTKFGLAGIIFATLIAYVLTVVLPYITFLRHSWISRLDN